MATDVPISADVGRLRLIRPFEFTNMLRRYTVLIDGQIAGQLRNKQVQEFVLPVGIHRLALKIDWCTTRPIDFDLRVNQLVSIQCRCGVNPSRSLSTVLASPQNYLQMTVLKE